MRHWLLQDCFAADGSVFNMLKSQHFCQSSPHLAPVGQHIAQNLLQPALGAAAKQHRQQPGAARLAIIPKVTS